MYPGQPYIQIRQAIREDNPALIRLTQKSPMEGEISLRIDRDPDFWSLLTLRGESTVYVAVKGEEVIGSFSGSTKKVWIDGKENQIVYLADLKILPAYRNGSTAGRLLRALYEHLVAQGADFCYCTIAEGNDKVLPLFQGRLGIPAFASLGSFSVFQILPNSRKKNAGKVYTIQDKVPPGVSLTSFYNQQFQTYQLAPRLAETHCSNTTNLIAFQGDEIIAAISLFDAQANKQYVVIDMSWTLKLLVQISRLTTKLLGIFRLPAIGESIKTLHVKYFACKSGHEKALATLLQQARNLAWNQGFHFLSMGFHEDDPLTKICKGVSKITFTSQGLVTSIHGNNHIKTLISEGTSFEDFSLS